MVWRYLPDVVDSWISVKWPTVECSFLFLFLRIWDPYGPIGTLFLNVQPSRTSLPTTAFLNGPPTIVNMGAQDRRPRFKCRAYATGIFRAWFDIGLTMEELECHESRSFQTKTDIQLNLSRTWSLKEVKYPCLSQSLGLKNTSLRPQWGWKGATIWWYMRRPRKVRSHCLNILLNLNHDMYWKMTDTVLSTRSSKGHSSAYFREVTLLEFYGANTPLAKHHPWTVYVSSDLVWEIRT